MIDPTDFHRMWIAVPDVLRERLADGQALICSHEQVQFVLAHVEDVTAWRAMLEVAQADRRPAYLLLLNHFQRTTLIDDRQAEVDVQDANLKKVGTIRLTGENLDQLRTELGQLPVTSTTADRLAAGDFFAVSERVEPFREWVVYQATSDFDTTRGDVGARRTAQMQIEGGGGRPAPTVTFRGAGQVVFLLVDPAQVLRLLGWERSQAGR